MFAFFQHVVKTLMSSRFLFFFLRRIERIVLGFLNGGENVVISFFGGVSVGF